MGKLLILLVKTVTKCFVFRLYKQNKTLSQGSVLKLNTALPSEVVHYVIFVAIPTFFTSDYE